MKRIKKLLLVGVLLVGLKAVGRAENVVSSTWSVLFISSAVQFDLLQVGLSTGYNNGAYFVCFDSVPVTANNGTSPWPIAGAWRPEEQLFPPIPFVASTTSVAGAVIGGQVGAVFNDGTGRGLTVTRGLTCATYGDTTNRHIYTIRTGPTIGRRPE